MIAAPLLPDGAAKPFDRSQRFIAGSSAGAILLPWAPVAADRNDGLRLAFGNRGIATLGIVSAIAANAEDCLVRRDLRQQIRQRRRIANGVCRDFDSPDIQRFRIDPDVDLTPLAAIGGSVFTGLPFPSPIILIPVLSTRRCNPPELGRPPRATGSVF